METTQEILNKLRDYKAAFAEKYGIERLGLSVVVPVESRMTAVILMWL